MSHRAEILMRFLRNLDKLSYHIQNETKLCHTLGYAVIEKGYLSLLFLPRCAIWRRHRNITLLMRKPPSFVVISLFIKHLSNIQMVLIHSLVITFFSLYETFIERSCEQLKIAKHQQMNVEITAQIRND